MSTSVPITTSAVTVTDNGSTVAVSVASSAVSVDVGTTGPQGATGPGVAAGGSTGQVLVKASGTNYDTSWTSSPTFGTATMTLGTATTLQAGTATLAAASIGSVSNAEIQYLDGLTEPLTTSLAGKTVNATLRKFLGIDDAAVDTFSRFSIGSTQPVSAGFFTCARFTPLMNLTVSNFTMNAAANVSGSPTLIRMGLYTISGTTATLVAACANDTGLFATTNTSYTRAFNTGGGLAATYDLVAGTEYGLGLVCVGGTSITVRAASVQSSFGTSLTPRLSFLSTGNTDLPASFTWNATSVSTVAWGRLT